jgi:hypothetical protein
MDSWAWRCADAVIGGTGASATVCLWKDGEKQDRSRDLVWCVQTAGRERRIAAGEAVRVALPDATAVHGVGARDGSRARQRQGPAVGAWAIGPAVEGFSAPSPSRPEGPRGIGNRSGLLDWLGSPVGP